MDSCKFVFAYICKFQLWLLSNYTFKLAVEMLFNKRNRNPCLTFNPRLALTGFWTTGPCTVASWAYVLWVCHTLLPQEHMINRSLDETHKKDFFGITYMYIKCSLFITAFDPFPTKDVYIHPTRCHPNDQGRIYTSSDKNYWSKSGRSWSIELSHSSCWERFGSN